MEKEIRRVVKALNVHDKTEPALIFEKFLEEHRRCFIIVEIIMTR